MILGCVQLLACVVELLSVRSEGWCIFITVFGKSRDWNKKAYCKDGVQFWVWKKATMINEHQDSKHDV